MKFDNIGDYWDKDTLGKISDLIHEFQDIFRTKFSKMKGIVGDLDEMKTPFRFDAKPVKQQPYRLNHVTKRRLNLNLIKC